MVSGKGVSRQAFAIYPKIREVDQVMTAKLPERVIEVHPELCFWSLAGKRSLQYSKRRPAGFDERRALLNIAFPNFDIPNRSEAIRIAFGAAPDDILDSMVAAWTAARFARGIAERVPPEPPYDPHGLRMEMVY